MPVFEYQGYDAQGKKSSGIVDADNSKSARMKMRQMGVLVTTISADSGGKEFVRNPLATVFNRITAKEITNFTRQLSTLQSGGLTLVESLDAMTEQSANIRFKKIITDIREQVVQGSSLADSLEEHSNLFDTLYVNLVRAGEASGALDGTLKNLAQYQENRLRQRARLISAMVYPLIMTVVGSAVLLFLMTYVMPKVLTMFEDMREALPLPTIILLWLSGFVTNWWPVILLGVTGAIIGLRIYVKTSGGKRVYDGLALKAPVFGSIVRTAAISRFARALSVLLSGGVKLVEALKITADIVGNVLLKEAIDQAIVSITEGQSISGPLKRSGLFPPIVTQMIDAGERSGMLTDMLSKISDAYDFEVEISIGTLTSLIEPALILFMGSVVMFIVMAILLPIFELSQFSF